MTTILWSALFAGFWFFVLGAMGIGSGWRILASTFPAPPGFVPDQTHVSWIVRSLRMQRGNSLPIFYGGGFTVGISDGGLYLAAPLLFRFLHPPTLIPWRSIRRCDEGRFVRTWVDCEVLGPDVTVRVYGSFGEVVRSKWQRMQLPAPAA
jgi:hypothetical protein